MKKIFCIFFAIIMVFTMILPSFAEEMTEEPEVLTDLKGMTFEGEAFSEEQFPADPEGEMKVLLLNEVGFCYDAANNINFGLYLYIYNPALIDVDADVTGNTIQLAVGQASADDRYEISPVTDYAQFDLELISSTSDKLYLKYKVVDAAKFDGKKIVESVFRLQRVYCCSGISLKTVGNSGVTEYTVGEMYSWEGYGIGCAQNGKNTTSTLSCFRSGIEVVEIAVNGTTWRSESVLNEDGTRRHQVDSVWFTVEDKYVEQYGRLVGVTCTWNGAYTAPLWVTTMENLYTAYAPYTGLDISAATVPNTGMKYGLVLNPSYVDFGTPNIPKNKIIGDLSYNMAGYSSANGFFFADEKIKKIGQIDHLFYVSAVSNRLNQIRYKTKFRDQYQANYGARILGGAALKEYFIDYSNATKANLVRLGSNYYDSTLFEKWGDEYGVSSGTFSVSDSNNVFGRVIRDISFTDNSFDLKALISDPNGTLVSTFWDTLVHWFSGTKYNDYTSYKVEPMIAVSYAEVCGLTDEEISNKYFVNICDVPAFREDLLEASLSGHYVYMLRFAATEYVCEEWDVFDFDSYAFEGTATRTQEAVFFDFDIISMTFKKGEKITVLPVSSDSTDIIGSVGDLAPEDDNSFWEQWKDRMEAAEKDLDSEIDEIWSNLLRIVFLFVFLVIVVLLWPVLWPLLSGAFGILAFPFKAVGKRMKKAKEKRKEKKSRK